VLVLMPCGQAGEFAGGEQCSVIISRMAHIASSCVLQTCQANAVGICAPLSVSKVYAATGRDALCFSALQLLQSHFKDSVP
jgi:hypothetical protein